VVKQYCSSELHWSDSRWEQEQADYQALWASSYSLPSREIIPDWKPMLLESKKNQKLRLPEQRRKILRRSSLIAPILLVSGVLIAMLWRHFGQSKKT
jgi:hypothetical protein